jgi:hypothetical protein
MINTIEDCLESVTGLTLDNISITIDESDQHIIYSIARQVFKGTALTDKQYHLMQLKLLKYKTDFEKCKIFNLDEIINKLRLPLRQIDRRKLVTILKNNHPEIKQISNTKTINPYTTFWIKVQFPFSKKLIVVIEKIIIQSRRPLDYGHLKSSNSHFFKLCETTVYDIVHSLKNKDFIIDEELVSYYYTIKDIKQNKEHYLPSYIENKFNNLNKSAIEFIKNDLDDMNDDIIIQDRWRRFGLNYVQPIVKTLDNDIKEIIYRKNTLVRLCPTTTSLPNIHNILIQLKRFPLLVLLDRDDCLEQLSTIHRSFNTISTDEQIVLFRLPNDGNYNINNYIKDNNFNTVLDNHTKIVYICKDKLPKLLISLNWSPLCVLSPTGKRHNTMVSKFIKDACDLIIFHENLPSTFYGVEDSQYEL